MLLAGIILNVYISYLQHRNFQSDHFSHSSPRQPSPASIYLVIHSTPYISCPLSYYSFPTLPTVLRQLLAKTYRECEKPMRIGEVWSGSLDIQLVRISTVPFGLPDHKSTTAGVAKCVGGLGLRGTPRKLEVGESGLK
ncbi:hypothetical protein AVEN_188246-1 [Araneus ventricosus]|uniref:Uncharacterized protein n=1 Tax=Araneus ventricosus TaxID=182803 RepID=A0A4Y2HD48_ARAVE|nr:hypothetical protein AVEN_188246-1 [Araneus ventricosus]